MKPEQSGVIAMHAEACRSSARSRPPPARGGRKDQRGLRESRRLLFLMGTDERKSRRGDKTAVELFLAGVRGLGGWIAAIAAVSLSSEVWTLSENASIDSLCRPSGLLSRSPECLTTPF